VIALLGAAIDYSFVYAWNPWSGYELAFSPAMWIIGGVLIMISVFLSYVLFLGIRPKVAVIPSASIAIVSPLAWAAIDAFTNTMFFLFLPLLAGIVAIALVLLGLLIWHRKRFPKPRFE